MDPVELCPHLMILHLVISQPSSERMTVYYSNCSHNLILKPGNELAHLHLQFPYE